ncbi:DUF2637 domain-containing protein [Streptomyces sp. NK08204]|uniref:DUF2637 domain-containing protein n=1 Tax=Streptomyces sp. NK08204 TaxID=2873260 RepID=UPI001CEDD00E|nr:DUF2637 domain-containing protein [Streptomyces sp. NK08204]
MYREGIHHHRVRSTDDLEMHYETGRGRHRAPTDVFSAPLQPPDAAWDPAEELAWMLQEAMGERRSRTPMARDRVSVTAPAPGRPMRKFQEIAPEPPPWKRVSRRHRKVRERKRLSRFQAASHLVAALAAVIASAVSFFSAVVVCNPLRAVAAARVHGDIVAWWPLMVYGPWLVASLSILRAAMHQRRAVHSWCIVLFFSTITIFLCVVQVQRTFLDTTAAALPGLASLACFQQAVRQVTLTRAPRRSMPRHRLRHHPLCDASDEGRTVAVSARTTHVQGTHQYRGQVRSQTAVHGANTRASAP